MKEIVSTQNGFAVKNENGEIISTFDRDRDTALERILNRNKHIKQVLENTINNNL